MYSIYNKLPSLVIKCMLIIFIIVCRVFYCLDFYRDNLSKQTEQELYTFRMPSLPDTWGQYFDSCWFILKLFNICVLIHKRNLLVTGSQCRLHCCVRRMKNKTSITNHVIVDSNQLHADIHKVSILHENNLVWSRQIRQCHLFLPFVRENF